VVLPGSFFRYSLPLVVLRSSEPGEASTATLVGSVAELMISAPPFKLIVVFKALTFDPAKIVAGI
jgi:hypothetical protein